MSREHERLQRLVANEAGVISAYFSAKQRYLAGRMGKTEMLDALREAGPHLVDGEAEVRELQAFDYQRQRRWEERGPIVRPPVEAYVSPSREPSRGPYR